MVIKNFHVAAFHDSTFKGLESIARLRSGWDEKEIKNHFLISPESSVGNLLPVHAIKSFCLCLILLIIVSFFYQYPCPC